jgi:hypothetical protein
MFKNLTDEELTSLYQIIKSSRDKMWATFSKTFGQTDYNIVFDMSGIMNDLHAENSTR